MTLVSSLGTDVYTGLSQASSSNQMEDLLHQTREINLKNDNLNRKISKIYDLAYSCSKIPLLGRIFDCALDCKAKRLEKQCEKLTDQKKHLESLLPEAFLNSITLIYLNSIVVGESNVVYWNMHQEIGDLRIIEWHKKQIKIIDLVIQNAKGVIYSYRSFCSEKDRDKRCVDMSEEMSILNRNLYVLKNKAKFPCMAREADDLQLDLVKTLQGVILDWPNKVRQCTIQKMQTVPALSHFPPGLLPLVVSFIPCDIGERPTAIEEPTALEEIFYEYSDLGEKTIHLGFH